MRFSTRQLVNIGFGVALLILAVVGVVAYRSATRLVETTRSVERTQDVLLRLGRVTARIRDAETGQRGYIITGEERYLEPYYAAVQEEDRTLRELHMQIRIPEQQQRLERLDSLVERKFSELQETIELRRNEGFESARAVVQTDRGRQAMEQIRELVRELQNVETELLAEQSQRAEIGARDTMLIIAAGTLLAFVLLGLGGLMINRNLTDQREAEERARRLIAEQAAREKAEEAERESRFLAEASALLAASLDIEPTLRDVARLMVSRVADVCLIDTVERDGRIERVAAACADPGRIDLEERLRDHSPQPGTSAGVPKVIRSGRSEMMPDFDETALNTFAHDEPHARLLREVEPRSCMIAPLLAHGRTLGALTLVSTDAERRYGTGDLRLAEELAHRVALAVENARLLQQARQATRARDEVLAIVSHDLRNPVHTIAKGIVEAHGGRIWVESRMGQGSTFFFIIPAAAPAAQPERTMPRET